MRDRVTNRVTVRHACLDDHVAALGPASRAPRHLTHQLKRPLRRTEIRQIQPRIRIDDPDQGDIGKIQPLGDHLRAQQDVHLATPHAIEDLCVGPFAAGRIDIHPRDAGFGKALGEHTLHLLRAESASAHRVGRTLWAHGGHRLLMLAVMTHENFRHTVVRERDAAVRAHRHITARVALHER